MMTAKEALERTKRSRLISEFADFTKDEVATLSVIERLIREAADEGETQCEVYANWLDEKIRAFLIGCKYNIIEDKHKPPVVVIINWRKK